MRLPEIGDELVSSKHGPFTVKETARHRGWLLVRVHSERHPNQHLVVTLTPEMDRESVDRFTDARIPAVWTDGEGIAWPSVAVFIPHGFRERDWYGQQVYMKLALDQREQELRQLEMAAHG